MITELLKRTFDIWCKKIWLRAIDRAIDRYNKTRSKANRERFALETLITRYNELYNENLGVAEGG